MTTIHITGAQGHTIGRSDLLAITIDDNVITALHPSESNAPVPGATIDADGLCVTAGFIDLQINGGYGLDLASSPESLWELGALLPQHGVTSFLPTIISAPKATTDAAIAAIADPPDGYIGATPLGLHFEGPMLNPDKHGAHTLEHLSPPDTRLIDSWARDTNVVLVTLAPELPNALQIAKLLISRGVTVSAGHTAATSADAHAAIDAGITMVTHLFNAMAPLGHRTPNLVGVALADHRLTAGLIVDGVHVDPTVIKATWNAKGPSGIALVTDAVAAMGESQGTHVFSGSTVIADSTSVRTRDGVLAGSVLTMDQAIRNLVDYTKCLPGEAFTSANATPARAIGETHRGTLEVGNTADVVLLNESLEVQITLCNGSVTFVAPEAAHRVPTTVWQGD